MSDELDGQHSEMAGADPGAEATAPLGIHPVGCGPEYGLRAGTGLGDDGPRHTWPDRATRHIQTTQGILSYVELAPLLAERVIRLEASLYAGAFDDQNLGSELVLDLHKNLCADLTPDWAGRWRNVGVTVGNLNPPPPHELPGLMHEYGLDLQARWVGVAEALSELTLEFLAFAEGRFLSIHPFFDFNGRTIRIFLLELLRRLDLPRVELAPQTEVGRLEYFKALEAADRRDWHPLIAIWKDRFTANH